jgi:hypothetical protein
MADPVDISSMPDPTTIGLKNPDPTDAMPTPAQLFKQHKGYDAQAPEEVAEFMRNPDATPDVRKAKSGREGLSMLTGLPRAAAGYAAAVPAGVASIAGQATGALGAALDPDNASDYLAQGRDRGREWAAKVNNRANRVPATKEGAGFANALMAVPGQVVQGTAGAALKATLPDNAYQAVADVATDVGNDLPALGAPGMVRAGARVAGKAAGAAKGAFTVPEPPAGTTYTAAGGTVAPTGALTPDVGQPVSGNSLRAQPNPIPAPEGTIHQAVHPASLSPQEAPASSPNDGSPPAQQEGASAPPAEPQAPSESPATQGTAETPPAQEPAPAAPSTPVLPDTDNAPMDMSMSPDQRALVREGVAARRAAADNQRGSVRLFNSPVEEGPQETPQPEQQDARAASLDAVDKLSGGMLPTRRASAIAGDYNATGDDWQLKETGSQPMRQQIASENNALHTATENVHQSIGSQFDNSVDPQTVSDRGRVTRNAIQGIQGWFDKATDQNYDAARAANGGRPIAKLQRVSDYLNDDSNFTNDAEIGLQRAAKQRLQRLWTTGDPDKGTPPGSVNAAERFREFLNDKGKNPNAMGVAGDLKNHLDLDVAEHGGPGLFQTARAMRRHSYQMLEEPQGIKKLLAPADSQGINHAIPEHKVMDYIADLPREQHEHVLNVLKAGAHLGGGELAESSAAAIREIQAHMVSRAHAAATNADGSWNARKFYNAVSSYAPKMADTFKDRPDVLRNLKTINDAGNTLHMDKHYPGAGAQIERTGLGSRALSAGGNIAASIAHEIPLGGRMVGRAIEHGVEKATGQMSEAARDKAATSRLVDRTGKQRGSVRVMNPDESPGARVKSEFDELHPEEAPAGYLGRRVGKSTAELYRDPGDPSAVHLEKLTADKPGSGAGTAALKKITDLADKHGARVTLDAVPQGANKVSPARLKAYYEQHGFESDGRTENSMTREPQVGSGATLNVGLHQGIEGQPGFRKMSKQEATGAVESTGAKVTKSSVLTPDAHGVAEPTLVASTDRPLSNPEMQKVLAKTKQSAIPQRTDAGAESMHVAPGHEAIAKQEGWDKFNPDYFRDHDGKPLSARMSGQRGSFSFQNDNALNRSVGAARSLQRGEGINPRNERNERVANQQMGGKRPLSAEQNEILRRLSGQRGSVRVMNEKPLSGAPEGDRPNGAARAAAKAYAKSANIDYKPLSEYRYLDPKVAKSVGDAYEEMKHDPTNPKVAKSYDAFKSETLGQYKQMVKAGVKVDLDKDYPYTNPREMHEDVRANNHMSVFPSDEGFGSGAAPSDHPMMEKAPIKMGGKDATYNDLFRAVHDYYGHAAEGNGFRANGEYNAWRAHRQMYSPEARGAMDSETLGQNSWVNSGPPAALNKGASSADTIYADQKAGLLPPKVVKSAEEGVGADEHHVTNQLTDQERGQLRADSTQRLVEAFHNSPATEEYAAAAMAGAAKRGWYKQSSQAIVNTFGHEAPRFAALLSAMSPQVSVQTNFANALKTYVNWDKEGRPTDPSDIRRIMEESSQKSAKNTDRSNVLDAWVNNGVRALTADDPSNVKLSGPKVHSFYNNLTDKVNEVTNDAWMASFAKIDPAKLAGELTKSGPGKSATYLALSGKVRQAASMLSRMTGETWTPAEVQETVWSWAKTAYEHAEEKGDRSIPDLVKNGDITDELIRSTPDFHQLFSSEQHRGLLQSSRFAGNDERVAAGSQQGANAAGPSEASKTAAASLRHHLLSAAERLEQVRQERRAAGKAAPKDESED